MNFTQWGYDEPTTEDRFTVLIFVSNHFSWIGDSERYTEMHFLCESKK